MDYSIRASKPVRAASDLSLGITCVSPPMRVTLLKHGNDIRLPRSNDWSGALDARNGRQADHFRAKHVQLVLAAPDNLISARLWTLYVYASRAIVWQLS